MHYVDNEHDPKELETLANILEGNADEHGVSIMSFDELNARFDARYHGE